MIMKAQLQITDPLEKKDFKKSTTLILTFFNQDDCIYFNEEDIEVLELYNRVQSPKIIDKAHFQFKQASQRGTFSSYGVGQMMQLSINNYQQQGVYSMFQDGKQQQQSARFQSYFNNLQQYMVQQLQLRTTQNGSGN
ncbi:unnamed protein product [Paramecium octaurelia]|uniref:Uncharacterized protein n=1 Tax=Paramecium octaurelia TaxID=43137 RepID=A0A8S1TFY7_PAROT|nr:unnamed protein product [Paramecium octaurelia]